MERIEEDKVKFKMAVEAPAAAAASDVSGTQRKREKELRYKNWLEQVTINAVEQALRFQVDESHRQQQGVGESHELQGCSSSNTLCNTMSGQPTCCHHRSWTLDRNSEERRIVAARIYSLLVQWKPDLSFEWRARVASAVHIFERALYREAKTKEEYLNSVMLDLQLRQILRHFEAGTGPSLLRKNCAEHDNGPLRKSVSFNSALIEGSRRPVALGALMKMHDEGRCLDEDSTHSPAGTVIDVELNERDSGDLTQQMREQESSAALRRDHLRKEEADSSLWEAILCGSLRDMEENLNKHRVYASKRVVKRVMGMLSKRKREEERKTEVELRKAMLESSVEKLAAVLTRARADFGEELKDLCGHAEVVLQRLTEDKANEDAGVLGMTLQGRVAESRRGRENAEITVEAPSPPPQQPRQSSGNTCRRSVTFSCRDNVQSSFENPNVAHDNVVQGYSQIPNDGHDNVDTVADRVVLDQAITHARNVHRRGPPRPLGSLLGLGWVPPAGRPSIPETQQPEPPRHHQSGGDRGSSNSTSLSEITHENPSNLAQPVVSAESTSDTAINADSSSSASADTSTQVPRISLMALLHQGADPEVFVMNRRRMSLGLRSETASTGEELTEEMIDGGLDPICCVCMVGKKGAAFIPCGHTFCRKCTRELRKGRGTCPLCNRSIQDVLKIY